MNKNENTGPFLFLIIISVVIIPSLAHHSPEDFLAASNKVRAENGIQPLEWSPILAAYANGYVMELAASGCHLKHSHGPYGENLAWCSGDLSGARAVELWAEEKAHYDYNTNCCAPGKMCGHYTQLVWRDTYEVGCAKVRCHHGGTLISCNYDPPGNYVGERPF